MSRLHKASKIIAALATLLPLALTIETLPPSMDGRPKEILRNPIVYLTLAFGSGYGACSDVQASLIAAVLAYVILDASKKTPPPPSMLYDDAS